jgi:hypothetical protein
MPSKGCSSRRSISAPRKLLSLETLARFISTLASNSTRPPPSRRSTGLAGVFARLAGSPHLWGTNHQLRNAAPLSDTARVRCPRRVASAGRWIRNTPSCFVWWRLSPHWRCSTAP